MSRQIDSKEFRDWLNKRIAEAKLSPNEIIDFNKWLITRSEHSEKEDVDEIGSDDFKDWLHTKIADAKLTPSEIEDFNKWLTARSLEAVELERAELEPAELEPANKSVSLKDVLEFVAWTKNRMSDLVLHKDERSTFSRWLTKRVSESSGLSEDEVNGAIGDQLT